MSVTRRPFRFELPTDVVRGDAWLPEEAVEGTAIVVCHGFKGFKDWGFFPYLGEQLAARTGSPVVCFNFTGSGVGESLLEFDELDRFATNTFSRELGDLEAVLDRLAAGRLGEVEVPRAGRFGLLGHSRGGATCVLKAASRTQVRGLVTWAAIASVRRYMTEWEAAWEAGQPVYILNARTGQRMPLHRNVLDDIHAHPDRLDVESAASALRIPYLVIHGADDEGVPVEEGRRLAAAAGEVARLEILEGAGHTMNAAHPFAGPNEKLERAIALSADHLRSALASE